MPALPLRAAASSVAIASSRLSISVSTLDTKNEATDLIADATLLERLPAEREALRGAVDPGYGSYALGKRMISIGPRETVFHHMDEVQQFDTADDFLAWSAGQ